MFIKQLYEPKLAKDKVPPPSLPKVEEKPKKYETRPFSGRVINVPS
jgi:hypothetical protein